MFQHKIPPFLKKTLTPKPNTYERISVNNIIIYKANQGYIKKSKNKNFFKITIELQVNLSIFK